MYDAGAVGPEVPTNTHSQGGEDGILEKLLDQLSIVNGYFVEFGAWDGRHLSNTYKLFEEGWSGCYIEADEQRFSDLQNNIDPSRVSTVLAYVSEGGPNCLDSILDGEGAPSTIDVLSIDIDSDDLAVFRGLQTHDATCVVIEYNPTIPIGVEFENPLGGQLGNSATSLKRLAEQRGYRLIAQTASNLILVNDELAEKHGISPIDLSPGTHFFFGYDGSLLRSNGQFVELKEVYRGPWGDYAIAQPLPQYLRHFDSRNRRKILISGISLAITRPVTAISSWRQRKSAPHGRAKTTSKMTLKRQ